MNSIHTGLEEAKAEATARIVRADGTEETVHGQTVEETVKFYPVACICGGVWLIIENTVPEYCTYCGAATKGVDG